MKGGHGVKYRVLRFLASLMLVFAVVFGLAANAGALDDKYRFEDFKMSVKVSKNYYVITRETAREDEVFETLELDYDETMTAFKAADIYLRAYDPDGVFQISMTVKSDDKSVAINNYSDLGEAERKDIVAALSAEPSVSSAVEVKHNGNIFFDTLRETALDSKTLYISQCNTIINGLQIDLSLQKADETILNDEVSILTGIASSMEFDEIRLKNTGPVFEWWRIALWIVILVILSILITVGYKKYNLANKRKLEERRRLRVESRSHEAGEAVLGSEPITFEEALGYQNDDQLTSRVDEDLDAYDISVEEKDPASGVSFFEDGGESIDERTDYFDTYFKQPTETRSGIARAFSTIGAYIGIAFRHIGFFFKNIFRAITGKKK